MSVGEKRANAQVNRKFLDAWHLLRLKQIGVIRSAIDALQETHRVADEVTGEDDPGASLFATLTDIVGMLRDRVDPESEVQLIELLSILLDKLEDQEARELAEEQN